MRKLLKGMCLLLISTISSVVFAGIASALSSTNYRFSEPTLGGVGTAETSSVSYKASSTGGILGFQTSAATGFQSNTGGTTTSDPSLAFGVGSGSLNFGTFSPGTTQVTTSTFEVSNYTSHGYIVQIVGSPPSNGASTLTAMSSTGPSQAGTKQFGINLVANTSPTSAGANPDHGQFGFGDAATNYDTTNNYRYVSGDTIATGPKSSGYTIYTITYIANVDSLTLGGEYSGSQTIICTATF